MVCFLTKNPIFYIFKAVGCILSTFGTFYGHSVYFVVIRYILWSFGIFCGNSVYFVVIRYRYFHVIRYIFWYLGIFCGHWVYVVVIWYAFPRFGTFCQEKSGNPATYLRLNVWTGGCAQSGKNRFHFLPNFLKRLRFAGARDKSLNFNSNLWITNFFFSTGNTTWQKNAVDAKLLYSDKKLIIILLN
jgi:hypothetical protein